MKGRGTAYEPVGKKITMGVGKHPSSKKDPDGKGTGPTNVTGRRVYSKCTGVVNKGVV